MNSNRLVFTPEIMQRVRKLAQAKMPRDRIARLLGLRLGSLEVKCHEAGIKLPHKSREPRADIPPGVWQAPVRRPMQGGSLVEPHRYREPVKHEVELPLTVMLPASVMDKLRSAARAYGKSERAYAALLLVDAVK